MDYNQFLSIMEIVCGIYCIVSALKMKQSGEINTTLLMSKENLYKKCKDKPAFLGKVIPRILILGVMVLLSGLANMWMSANGGENAAIGYVIIVILIGTLIWYSVSIRKIIDQYY